MFVTSRPSIYRTSYHNNKSNRTSQNVFKAKVNVVENETQFRILMAIPGFSREDLNITVEEEVLTIASEKDWKKGEQDKITYQEFKVGQFKRSFVLPDAADSDKIEASVKDGLLEVKLAKKAKAQKQVIAVA